MDNANIALVCCAGSACFLRSWGPRCGARRRRPRRGWAQEAARAEHNFVADSQVRHDSLSVYLTKRTAVAAAGAAVPACTEGVLLMSVRLLLQEERLMIGGVSTAATAVDATADTGGRGVL